MGTNPLLAFPGVDVHLATVDERLLASVTTEDAHLTEMTTHLIRAGGKRLRPLLGVLSAATGEAAGGTGVTLDVIDGGVAVELVQVGSLYHDDVIDEADSRRGVESVNVRWNNLTAILAGDFLLAKASEIAARLGTEVAELLAKTIGRLCEGEILELRHAYSTSRTEDAYFAAIEGKTASLYATACRIGAIVGELPRADVDALTEYGNSFGMAFQIVDDILDCSGDTIETGKVAGTDLREGTPTLPLLLAARKDDVVRRALAGGPVEGALVRVAATGALERSREVALDYARQARDLLRDEPRLEALTHLVIERKS
jgi:heptaprenyl diphosphate synthase